MRSVSGWNNTRREVMVNAALLSSKFEIQQPAIAGQTLNNINMFF
jgi:hypothetical protein